MSQVSTLQVNTDYFFILAPPLPNLTMFGRYLAASQPECCCRCDVGSEWWKTDRKFPGSVNFHPFSAPATTEDLAAASKDGGRRRDNPEWLPSLSDNKVVGTPAQVPLDAG